MKTIQTFTIWFYGITFAVIGLVLSVIAAMYFWGIVHLLIRFGNYGQHSLGLGGNTAMAAFLLITLSVLILTQRKRILTLAICCFLTFISFLVNILSTWSYTSPYYNLALLHLFGTLPVLLFFASAAIFFAFIMRNNKPQNAIMKYLLRPVLQNSKSDRT
jgi:hypothetical protein